MHNAPSIVEQGSYVQLVERPKYLFVMKTLHSFILFFSVSFVCHVSSLYIGNHDHRKFDESFKRNDENFVNVVQQRRENSIGRKFRFADKQRSFIKCVFKFHDDRMPEYTCDHSKDVVIKWREEKGQLIGTITTNYRSPKQRSVTNEMQSPWYMAWQKWKQLIREKRRTIYRGNAEDEEAPNKANDQIDEDETIVSKVARQAEDDTNDDSEIVEAPVEADDENAAEKDDASSVIEVENDEGDENEEKEVSDVDTTSGEGSPADKEISDVGKAEKEVNDAEKEKDQEENTVDKEVPDEGGSQGDEGEKIEEVTSTEEENGDEENDDNDDDDDDDDDDADGPAFMIQIDVGQIVPVQQIGAFLTDIGTIITDAGDYILALILKDMKRRLHVQRINERFDTKVEKLANRHSGNTDKAIQIMEKRIRKRLGQNYEAHIIKFLKELRDSMKT